MNVFLAVFRKDLLAEWRSRERLPATLLFALVVVLVLRFAQPGGTLASSEDVAPGLLWVAYVFAAVLGLSRSLALELENDAISGLALAPADRGWIFLGKAAANFLFIALAQFVTTLVCAVVFDTELASVAGPMAGIALLGALGLSAIGTLSAAISIRTRYPEAMLPLLLFPLLIPLVIAAVQATAGVMAGSAVPRGSLELLAVYALVALILSFILFEYVLDE